MKTSVRILDVLTDIRTHDFQKPSINNYRYITLLGPSSGICRRIGEHPKQLTEEQLEGLEEPKPKIHSRILKIVLLS
jgi:hypothetical protein